MPPESRSAPGTPRRLSHLPAAAAPSALPPHLTREISSLSLSLSPQPSSPSSCSSSSSVYNLHHVAPFASSSPISRPSSTRTPSVYSDIDVDIGPPPSLPHTSGSGSQSDDGHQPSSTPTAQQQTLPPGQISEQARIMLRGQLKRSLSRPTIHKAPSKKGKERTNAFEGVIQQTPTLPDQSPEKGPSSVNIPVEREHRSYPPRKYFILTNAGKPVYASETDETELNTIVGVIQALISIFLDQDQTDKLRTITKGDTKIVFLLRQPLYYACVSSWGEPESVLRLHLEYLHLQVLSILTGGQLTRIFNARGNFDLRRLLQGTENFFTALVDTLQSDFSYLTYSLQPLRVHPALRDAAGQALLTASKSKDLLYALILTSPDLHILTLLRPTKHSIHPTDLHILLNLIRSSPDLTHPENESWLPVCLPRYDQDGFVYVYVTFGEDGLGFVGVGKAKDGFEEMRDGRTRVMQKLEEDNKQSKLSRSIALHPYSVSDLGIPNLLHFIYKSCVNVQLTQPRWEGIYEKSEERRRLSIHYQQVHDALHARSSPGAEPLTLLFVRTDTECILGWFTQPFELYMTLSPSTPKSGCISIANRVARS
ncbi:duf254-domain-containing protein [Phaffia rhodozyma]|uniref:Vacuolar fusion protein MON1 n=1 Tax=Phaffia rhodozyma TaxID=264483 RepID=A0A0F7SSM3_PHARH|nr:duf254-domain-containing protein [Phaffia rhodozyma]